MKPPPLPSDEVQRLQALRGYDLLDTLPEQSLDDLTTLAAQICEVPIALISLVDEERQWFKSKVGMSLSETPRDISFCGHAILQSNLFIVPDATQDERFADNPLVTDSRIRFYAGAPLVTPSGHTLGALCIMDHVPRQLTAKQQASLLMLARQVMSQLELHRQTHELRESEACLHIVTENARVGLFMLDRDRRYLYASKAYAEILGLSLDSIIGQRLPDLLVDIYEERIRPQMDRAFAGERVSFEAIRQLPDGPHHFSATYEPRMTNGHVNLVVGVITDVTESKRAKQALRDSKARLDFALQTSRTGAWELDLQTHTAHRTLLHDQIFGYESMLPNWDYETFLSHVLPEDRPAVDKSFRDATAKQTAWSFECRIRRVDGEIRWIWASGGHHKEGSGESPRLAGIVQDITERKQIEEALRESTRFAHSTIDALSSQLCVLDEHGNILATNEAWRHFAGPSENHPLRTTTGSNYLAACDSATGIGAADGLNFARGIRAVLTGKSTEFALEYASHSPTEQRWFIGRVTRFHSPGPIRIVVAHENITQRKLAEEALRQSELALHDAEERWQFAVLAADMGVWDWNLETNVVYHSERWCTMLGYEPGEITDQLGEWSSRMHPQDLESAMARLHDHLEGRNPLYQSEHRMRTKDGQYRWIQDRAKVMSRDATGRPLRMVGTHTDITDRKSSELASQRLVAIVESSDDAIIGKDLESIITSWNRGAEKIFGYTAAEIVGTSILRLIPENRYEEESYILDRIKLGKSVEHFETMRCTKTGSLINVSVTASPIKDATGKVIGVSKVARDISIRKREEERMLWLSSFPERNPNAVLELDLISGLFHYINPSALRQFPDLPVKGIHHPLATGLAALKDSTPEWKAIQRELVANDRCFSQMITFDPDSQRVRIYSSDITARKQAENALRIQQEHSQSLLQLSRKLERVENYQDILSAARETVETVLGFKRLWIYQLTEDGKYLKLVVADDGMTKAVRAQEDDLLLIAGDPMLEEIAACRDIVVVEDARTDPRTNKEIVARLRNLTIVNVPVMLAGKTLGTIGTGTFGDEGVRPISPADQEFLSALASHVAAVIDRVTASEARLKAEAERRASEERLRTVTDTAQVGLTIVDQEHRYRYANPSYARILRLPTHHIVGQRVSDVLSEAYPERIAPRLKRAFAGERVNYELTMPATAAGDEPRYFVVTYEPKLDHTNPLVVVVIVDITERKLAELSLQEEKERFRQLAENINEVFWITNPTKNEMLYISPAYEKIWGRTCASLYAAPHTWLDVIHPEDRQRVQEASQSKQAIGEYDEIYRITRPDGSVRWINDRAFPIRNALGQVHRIVGTAEDITARRQLEEQFRQSQKMEAIGQLAGGVAHDFNNILAAIMMQTEMAIMEPDLSTDLREGLCDIRSAADRAANLTRQLLLFSRKQVMNTGDLNLNDVVLNLAKMLQRIIGEHLSLQYNLHPGQLTAHADAGMLDQVLLNLVVNARDAMPMGGRILIATFYKTLTPEEASAMPDAAPGNYVCLRVSDTGCGISAENFPHIFEPFFTTKGPGKGTGLGLATVFGIVKQHGGAITVQSQVDHGTTFQIFLPAVQSTSQFQEEAEFRLKARGGTETILLVEDDPSVRILTSLMLERSGYKVLAAPNGVQALKIWELHKASIRLLLTDIVMPEGVNGIELASRLQAQKPQLKVILTSGYSADIAGRDISLQEGQKFIQKPSPPNHILETIRQSLDS